jgi:hypothetical protein
MLVFALQILALNNVNVFNVGFPMLYPMIVILLPIRQPVFVILMAAFCTGLSIDFFTNTGGLHAAALTFMGFVRISILNKLEPQAEYGKEDTPGLRKFGWRWMLIYTALLIFAHHFTFFLIEESSLAHIGEIILKTIVSSILSFILMLSVNTLIFRR